MDHTPHGDPFMESLLADTSDKKLFELLHTGIAIFSVTGHLSYCNKAFLETYNLTGDVVGRHVTDVFVTGEQGVMTTIRTKKPTFCSSLTTGNTRGISFRYPMLDKDGNLYGVLLESISPSVGRERLDKLMETIRNLEIQSSYLEQKSRTKVGKFYSFENIIGRSEAFLALKRRGELFSQNTAPILIMGESGVGKELIAQAVHVASPRSANPFVTVNCAALPDELMEAELFGYDSGAFTGARSGGMKGKFELANTGTIFLDEVGELPLQMQAKLLRVLESGEIQKIGHGRTLHSDFRLITATNRDLARCVKDGTFREDLYHRLNIFELRVPPLRERLSDLPLLVDYFVERTLGAARAKGITLSPELFDLFSSHPWKGNIRELRNILTYALFSMRDGERELRPEHLPERFFEEHAASRRIPDPVPDPAPDTAAPRPADVPSSTRAAVKKLDEADMEAERQAILDALAYTRFNRSRAAEQLGISRSKLYKLLRRYGIE